MNVLILQKSIACRTYGFGTENMRGQRIKLIVLAKPADTEVELKHGQDTRSVPSGITPLQAKDSLALHVISSYLKGVFFFF